MPAYHAHINIHASAFAERMLYFVRDAGFLQWKALLGLLFNCDEAATGAHTALFAELLQTVSAQLSFAAATSEDTNCGSGEGVNASGAMLGMGESVFDMLQGSFLKQQALAFLEVLVDERDSLPADLWHQVRRFCSSACTQ
jgi:AAR2 protein